MSKFFLAIHLILILAGTMVLWGVIRTDGHWDQDFTALYTGWTLARSSESHDLYNLATQQKYEQEILARDNHDLDEIQDGILPYLNPPHLTWLFIPLSFINRQLAFILWTAINLLCLAGIVYSLWNKERLLLISAFLALPLVLIALGVGTLSLFVTLAIIRAYIAVKKGRDIEAAFWLLLATVKPQMVLFPLVAFLMIRGLKLLVPFVVMVCVSVGISIAIIGLTPVTQYLGFLQTISRQAGRMSLLLATTTTFRGILYSLFGYNNLAVNPISVAAMLLALALTVYLWRAQDGFEEKVALTVLLGLIFGLHVNPQDDVLIILPATILWSYYRHVGSKYVALVAVAPVVLYIDWRTMHFHPFSPTLHLLILGMIVLSAFPLWRPIREETI